MKTYRIILIVSILLSVFGLSAQERETELTIIERLDTTSGLTLIQPIQLIERLKLPPVVNTEVEKPGDKKGAKQSRPGSFSIEVYSDNSKQAKVQATNRKRAVQSRFPQYPARLVFDSPFWRVRIGNFRNHEDAEKAMSDIRRAFPTYSSYLRIVGR